MRRYYLHLASFMDASSHSRGACPTEYVAIRHALRLLQRVHIFTSDRGASPSAMKGCAHKGHPLLRGHCKSGHRPDTSNSHMQGFHGNPQLVVTETDFRRVGFVDADPIPPHGHKQKRHPLLKEDAFVILRQVGVLFDNLGGYAISNLDVGLTADEGICINDVALEVVVADIVGSISSSISD